MVNRLLSTNMSLVHIPLISLGAHVGWLVLVPQDKEHPAASLLPLALPGKGKKAMDPLLEFRKQAQKFPRSVNVDQLVCVSEL